MACTPGNGLPTQPSILSPSSGLDKAIPISVIPYLGPRRILSFLYCIHATHNWTDSTYIVTDLSNKVWPETSLHLLKSGVGRAAEPLHSTVASPKQIFKSFPSKFEHNLRYFIWGSPLWERMVSPYTKPEVVGQSSHSSILFHLSRPMMLHQL